MFKEILNFWFNELEPKQWWTSSPELDALLKERFLEVWKQAAKGELYAWRTTAAGRLAEIIVLDQFSRNLYRNTSAAFAQDAMALVLSQEAVSAGALNELNTDERAFLLMPFMHSESKLIHAQAEQLFKDFTSDKYHDYEMRPKVIIDRFRLYPHRNSILGRTSTAEELEFLQQPGSSF